MKYFAKRLGFALFTLMLGSFMTFLILRAMPGDIVEMMARTEAQSRGINLEDARKIVVNMINYDPDEPLISQLARYYGGLLRGNLGISMFSRTLTVNTIIANTLPWTMFVLSISLTVSFLIGTRLGTLMAWKRNSFINPAISVYAIITTAIPNFIFGVLLILSLLYQFELVSHRRGVFTRNKARLYPGVYRGHILSRRPSHAYLYSHISRGMGSADEGGRGKHSW
ncbi:MAG: hypothetical protein ACOX6S_11555 [Clostridia bacterium]